MTDWRMSGVRGTHPGWLEEHGSRLAVVEGRPLHHLALAVGDVVGFPQLLHFGVDGGFAEDRNEAIERRRVCLAVFEAAVQAFDLAELYLGKFRGGWSVASEYTWCVHVVCARASVARARGCVRACYCELRARTREAILRHHIHTREVQEKQQTKSTNQPTITTAIANTMSPPPITTTN
jgi:hypothetical protein